VAQVELFCFYTPVECGGYEAYLQFNKNDGLLANYFCYTI